MTRRHPHRERTDNEMNELNETSFDQLPDPDDLMTPPNETAAGGRRGSPEDLALLERLKTGDAATVREILVGAFRKHYRRGFALLATACVSLEDDAMCARLFEVFTELRRYAPFALAAYRGYFQIVGMTRSPKVRRLAAAGIGEFMYHDGLPVDVKPYTSSARKRICALLEKATTGANEANAQPAEPSPPAAASRRATKNRAKTLAAPDAVAVPALARVAS